MDPNNPIVMVCAAGMKAEMEGKPDEARRLFLQAWEQSNDDYEACIAAHYVARHQTSPEDVLRWNQAALDLADAVNDERVRTFYPSLYLNLGKIHEDLGNHAEARSYYELAANKLNSLPESSYANVVRRGIQRALQRVP